MFFGKNYSLSTGRINLSTLCCMPYVHDIYMPYVNDKFKIVWESKHHKISRLPLKNEHSKFSETA